MKTIIFSPRAAKELDAMPEDAKAAVTSALTEYAVSGAGDVKALTGRDGYRLRVGRFTKSSLMAVLLRLAGKADIAEKNRFLFWQDT